MAKKAARQQAIPSALRDLSARTRKAIEAIRRPFAAFVDDFRLIMESRAELAPRFMKACGLWQTETGGTFVDFCRVLVPEIGPSREEYRAHPAYQAADYLRRLAGQQQRAETTPTERARRIAAAPVSPTTAVARILRAFMPLIQPEQAATLWDAFRTQLHWNDRTVTRIQNEAQQVEPIVILREPRGLHAMGTLRLAMPAPAAEEGEAEEPRTGTHG